MRRHYILTEEQPHFHVIKKYYTHFFHGRSKEGYPVYYEQVLIDQGGVPGVLRTGVNRSKEGYPVYYEQVLIDPRGGTQCTTNRC
jgi:hypothetical protein